MVSIRTEQLQDAVTQDYVDGYFNSFNDIWFSTIAINVLDYGAIGDGATLTDGIFINEAIAAAKAAGVGVIIPPGVYLTTVPIIIPTDFPHIISGFGPDNTIIRLANGADCNVMESENFELWTGTPNMPIPSSGGSVYGFQILNLQLDGNRDNNYSGVVSDVNEGYCLRIHGKKFLLKNLILCRAAGIGLRTERGSATPDYVETIDQNWGGILNITIVETSYEGFVFMGPSDIYVDNITIGKCHNPSATTTAPLGSSLLFPGESIDGMVVCSENGMNGTIEIGFVHSYGCRQGWCFRASGNSGNVRIRADNITAEGGIGCARFDGSLYGNVKVNTRNNEFGAVPRANIDIATDPGSEIIYEYLEARHYFGNSNGSESVHINCYGAVIGTIKVSGNSVPNHGVRIASGCEFLEISEIHATYLQGTCYDGYDSTALWIESGCDYISIGRLKSLLCDVGLRNEASTRVKVEYANIRVREASLDNVAALQFISYPDENYFYRGNILTDQDDGLKYGRFNGQIEVDATTTDIQDIVVAHNLWFTPFRFNVHLSILEPTGTAPQNVLANVHNVDATNITIRFQCQVVGTGLMHLGVSVN